jgi:hypothetical protein
MQSPFEPALELPDCISLRIVLPRVGVKTVLAPRSASISSLKPLLPNPNAALIFNGTLHSDDQTVEFYRLHENDSLVAVPQWATPDATNRWMKITQDSDSFTDSVHQLLNPGLLAQGLKLRDQAMLKGEMRPRALRKFMQSAIQTLESGPPTFPTFPTIIPDQPSQPSETPLPVPW